VGLFRTEKLRAAAGKSDRAIEQSERLPEYYVNSDTLPSVNSLE